MKYFEVKKTNCSAFRHLVPEDALDGFCKAYNEENSFVRDSVAKEPFPIYAAPKAKGRSICFTAVIPELDGVQKAEDVLLEISMFVEAIDEVNEYER